MAYDVEKERREAIMAGQRALDSLERAQHDLNNARLWGVADIFGGGLIISLIKHAKMDDARGHLNQAKWDLQSFSRELADVNMAHNLNVDMGDFLTFADFFFDGLVADVMAQEKINEARRQVADAITHVQYILGQLENMH